MKNRIHQRSFLVVLLVILGFSGSFAQTISNVSPSTAAQNATTSLTITGIGTNFTTATGASIQYGGTTVIATNFVGVSATTATFDVALPGCATQAGWNVNMYGAAANCIGCLTVTGTCPAAITTVSPNTGTQLSTFDIDITSPGANFSVATPFTLQNGATILTATNPILISPTVMRGTIAIPGCSTPGAWNVDVGANTNTLIGGFTLTGTCPANITSVFPNAAELGQTVTVVVTSPGANFSGTAPNITLQNGATTLTSTGSAIINTTTVSGTFVIPSCIPLGLWNVDAGTNTNTMTGGFTLTAGGAGPSATIRGLVFEDLNNNCTQQVGEPNLGGQIISISPGYFATTGPNGQWSAVVPLGTYTVTWSPDPNYINSCTPASYTVNAVTNCATYNNNNFKIRNPAAVNPDPAIIVTSNNARPGFLHYIQVHVQNLSVDPTAGNSTVTVTMAPSIVYQSSFPLPISIVGNTLTYNFPSLTPLSNTTINITTTIPVATPLGANANTTATIAYAGPSEVTTINNSSLDATMVTGAQDPNDKRVWTTNGAVADPWIEPTDNTLRYMVRFQNVGTDTAFNIVCRDTMDMDVNPATFIFEGSSHPAVWDLSTTGRLTITFPNALLVDSATNEPLSHGWFAYRINVDAGLPEGTLIRNRCSNYFDFATPVATNFTNSTICSSNNAAFTNSTGSTTINFTNTSTGSITTYAWTFGDGGTSTAASPTHVYATPGIYNVCLIVNNGCGRSDTTCTPVEAGCVPLNAGISPNFTNLSGTFTGTSPGIPTSWAWTFGDGGTSNVQNPTHTYAAAGTYNVCLIVTSGCTADTTCNPITVSCVVLNPNIASSSTQLTANFNGSSSGTPTSWAWTFGDGGTSGIQNPSHTYPAAGSYNVCLIVGDGCSFDTTCNNVNITCAVLNPNFSNSATNLVAAFTGSSSGTITTWAWTFGDGGTSNVQNPSHTYAAAGSYNVCLIVGDGCSFDTTCNNVNVTCASLSPSFTSNATFLTTAFTGTAGGTPTTWNWDFGDGQFSSTQNPTHVYSAPGTYNVCLIVSSNCMTDTTCNSITVNCAVLNPAFTSTATNLSASFNGSANGAPTTWSWDFGDGLFSNAQNPGHVYSAPGTYNVCLTITSQCGSNTVCHPVTVTCAVVNANFNYTSGSGNEAIFTNSSAGATTYSWDFGDGTFSSAPNPTHIYGAPGIYEVCLVADNNCTTDTTCFDVAVSCPNPVSDFTTSGAFSLMSFTDLSTGSPTSWSWNFGDGSANSTQQNPTHAYAFVGSYNVCLTTTSTCGTSTVCELVDALTGVDAGNFQSQWVAYPNPTDDEVWVSGELKGGTQVTLTLVDELGRILTSEVIDSPAGGFLHKVDMRELATGIYLIRIEAEGSITTKHISRN
jgi:PKD repeat protein